MRVSEGSDLFSLVFISKANTAFLRVKTQNAYCMGDVCISNLFSF